MFKMRVTGTKQAEAKSHALERHIKQSVATALHNEGERIMRDSKANYVPVVHGGLKESGVVHPPQIAGSIVSVLLEYPGPEAIRIHENPRSGKTGGVSPRGRKYPEGSYSKVGGWKFLELPAKQAMPSMPSRIAQDVGAMLRLMRW